MTNSSNDLRTPLTPTSWYAVTRFTSLGIPQIGSDGALVDALQFADTRLSPAVERGLFLVPKVIE